jgi:hypothetical protein
MTRYVISVTLRREVYIGVTFEGPMALFEDVESAAKRALLLDLRDNPPKPSDIDYNVITSRPDFGAQIEVTA